MSGRLFVSANLTSEYGGLQVIASGETFAGASKFASGVGKHGAFGREVND